MDVKAVGLQFAQLSAAARESSLTTTQLENVFVGVATASVALGLSSEQTTGAMRALQQMMSKGTVQAEELRGQLGERIPGAFGLAAKAMGVTTKALGKMLEQGQVLADELLPKLATEFISTFGVQAQAAATGLLGEYNKLITAISTLLDRSEALINLMRKLASVVRSVRNLVTLGTPNQETAQGNARAELRDIQRRRKEILERGPKGFGGIFTIGKPENNLLLFQKALRGLSDEMVEVIARMDDLGMATDLAKETLLGIRPPGIFSPSPRQIQPAGEKPDEVFFAGINARQKAEEEAFEAFAKMAKQRDELEIGLALRNTAIADERKKKLDDILRSGADQILILQRQLNLGKAQANILKEELSLRRQIPDITDIETNKILEQVAAREALIEKIKEQADQQKKVERAAKKATDALILGLKGALTGAKTLKQSLRSIVDSLIEIALRAAIEVPARGFFEGLFKSVLGGTISGAGGVTAGREFAHGGSPPVGKASVVGEQGPEVFVPNRAGTIIPNGGLGGDTITITQNFDFKGATLEAVSLLRRESDSIMRGTIAAVENRKQRAIGRR